MALLKMISTDEQSRPMLARGVRLRNDPITGEPILLFPEGFLPLDEIAYDILRRCSGKATLESIIVSLAEEYETDRDTIRSDVCECLVQLREQMLITLPK
jgi:pyrroloquinoline quinone biosynthesis protein D